MAVLFQHLRRVRAYVEIPAAKCRVNGLLNAEEEQDEEDRREDDAEVRFPVAQLVDGVLAQQGIHLGAVPCLQRRGRKCSSVICGQL